MILTLANAGGVTCSHFEQVQSNANYYWEKDEVLAKLDIKMTKAFHDVYELAKSTPCICVTLLYNSHQTCCAGREMRGCIENRQGLPCGI